MKFVSLYSGAGGLDAGFVKAGFKPVWANDNDRDAARTYERNIGGKHMLAGTIEDHWSELPDADGVDLVIGGPPCQGFSVAGHMRDDDPRSAHVWKFFDVVERVRPETFVMENVAALAVNRRWSTVVDGLKQRAGQLGFRTAIYVLDSSHFGVPQSRKRMIFVGHRSVEPVAPEPISAENPPTVRAALNGLPAWGCHGNDGLCTAKITPAKRPVLRRSPYAGMLFNGKGRAMNLDSPAPTLAASMGGNRTPVVDQESLLGDKPWIVGYHRRLMGGAGPVQRIPRRMRRITVQEAAVLQSFPSNWQFFGTQSSQFRQIGNAVPPGLSLHVARSVIRAFEL